MSAQRRLFSLRGVLDALGFAAVAATLVLSWPGVRIARAEDPPAARAEGAEPAAALMSVDPLLVQGPAAPAAQDELTCANPGVPSPLNDAMIEHQIRRSMRELAQRMAAEQPDDGSGDHGVVLNGHGYNYRPARGDALR